MDVVGRGGAERALADVAAEVWSIKADDSLAPVVVVTPTHTSGVSLRRYLARATSPDGARTGVAGVDVTTFPRLAERLAGPLIAREGRRRPLTDAVLAGTWRAVLSEDPSVFAPVVEHAATATALVRAYRELRAIDDDAWDGVAQHSDATADVVRLARSVRQRLELGWYDEQDLLGLATERLTADANGSAAPHVPVVLHLPQDLVAREQRLVAALAARGDCRVVPGATGDLRADEHLVWVDLFADQAEPTPAGEPPAGTVPSSPAAPLVYRPTAQRTATGPTRIEGQPAGLTEEALPSPPLATRVVTASDSDDEVRFVVREVVRALSEGTRADRIAVLYSAANPYARLLHEQLGAAGITVNGPGIDAAADSAIGRFLLSLLDLDPDAIPRGHLFDLLAEAPVRDRAGARLPVSVWERISRAAGVVEGADWVTRLAHYTDLELDRAAALDADGRGGAARYARTQGERAQALASFVATLRSDLVTGGSATTWEALTSWARHLIATYLGIGEAASENSRDRHPPSEQYAAAAVLTALQRLESLDDVDAPASVPALSEALRSELERAVPRVGRFGDGVLVAPIGQGIGLDLDLVHLVGMSEDLCPGRSGVDAVLPEALREGTPGLRDVGDGLARTHRHVLLALAGATTAVASFPRGDLRTSGTRLPSRFLLPSLRALGGDADLVASDWQRAVSPDGPVSSVESYASELLRTTGLATEQEWRTRGAVAHTLQDALVDAARELVDARAGSAFTRFDGNLAGADGLPTWLPDSRPVSPTALENYASCPHAYFVGRLLSIEPIENPESLVTISPMQIGNLIHHALDRLVERHRDAGTLPGAGEPWSPEHHAQLLEIAAEVGEEMTAAGLTGHPRLWELERARIVLDLTALLQADDAIRAERGAEVLTSEMPFGLRGAPPLTLQVGDATVHLRGAADKVDRGADGTIYVTDIKTGSNRSFKSISQESPTAGASKLQLPAYALAARAAFGTPETPVHAEYRFVRKDKGAIGVDLDDAVEQAFHTQVGVLTRSIAAGVFPRRPPDAADFLWVQCAYCNPDGVGHGLARERWERQRLDPALRELVGLLEPDVLTGTEGAS